MRFRHSIDKALVLCAIASLLAFLSFPAIGFAQGVKAESARAKTKGGHRGHAHKPGKKRSKHRPRRSKPAAARPAVHQATATASASASTSAKPPSTPRTPPTGGDIPIPADARYVSSTTGSDSNPGTSASPWRSIAKAASSAGPGDVVVLMPGTYGAPGTTTSLSKSGTASAPITFTSLPGAERATVKGYVRIGGSHIRINSLLFDGPTGPIQSRTAENPGGEEVQVSIMYGSDVELAHSEIRDDAWHAGVFVYAGSEIRIDSNYIHDNGDAATGANFDHGVYWCSGSGSVTNNLIEDNVAYGVHLYPEAREVVVANNTIAGNGRGGIIVANTSSQNQLLNNVVTDNAMYGIRGYDLSGGGNVARNNLLWNNGENISGSGIAYSGTLVQAPQS